MGGHRQVPFGWLANLALGADIQPPNYLSLRSSRTLGERLTRHEAADRTFNLCRRAITVLHTQRLAKTMVPSQIKAKGMPNNGAKGTRKVAGQTHPQVKYHVHVKIGSTHPGTELSQLMKTIRASPK